MWEELKTFIEVVEQQSFTKAAQKLNISQPTVSLHIRRLEECFNAVLIRRSKKQKQLSVTYAGMIVYDAAKQMKSLWQFTEITVKELGSEIKGRLAIGASLTIGEYFLPEFLGRFMKRYPQLDIEVKIDNNVHICELLQSNKIDVGLVEGETGDKKFHKEEFYIDRLVLIGPIGSPKKMQRRDLETVTWITREQGSGTRVQWEEFLEKNSVLPAKTIIFNTNFAVKEAVRNDLGYALLSEHIAKQAAAAGEVELIETQEEAGRKFVCLTLASETMSRNVQTLVDNLKRDFVK